MAAFVVGSAGVGVSGWVERRGVVCGAAKAPAPAAGGVRRAQISMDGTKTINENMSSGGVFKTLVAAAAACEAFGKGTPGSFTVFAPTDRAFSQLRPGTLEALLKPENKQKLLEIVKYHVVPGPPITLKKLTGVGTLNTAYGGELPYSGSGNVIRVGGALVIPDNSGIEASNGIIHAIDSVIVPPGIEPAGVDAGYIPEKKLGGSDSVITSFYTPDADIPRVDGARARGAALPSTVGGRRAMNLLEQKPFWMYGPPYNAAYQTDYEPISAAEPVASVDYQLMPEGSVVVEPDSVNSNDLNPVSGMSSYIGKTSRLVEGAALSDYADKTTSMD